MNSTDPTPSSPFLPPEAESPRHQGSTEDLFAFLYEELHRLAERHLRHQGSGLTLGTTTLLHELYLKVADPNKVQFSDRARFMGYASRAMRGLIVDYSRRRGAAKRGGEFHLLPLGDEDAPNTDDNAEDLSELGEALDELATLDPRLAELVDLRFFCGLTFVEIAGLRGVSERTVLRDWRKARLILHRVLRPAPTEDVPG
jgi:RNA polymerase sigma factor (TIGR02999 family)